MERKLIVVIALATLTQSSCAQQSPDYGLSESKSAQLRGIIGNQEDARVTFLVSIDPIFDLIDILSTARKHNLQLKDDSISSLIARALTEAKNGTDYTFNSIPVILGRACNSIEKARNASHGDLENAFTQIGYAIGLAMSWKDDNIRPQFDVFSAETYKSFGNFVATLYGAIRTCVNTNNADTQAAIEVREIESLQGLLRATNAVFDAIKVFAAGIPAEGDGMNVIPSIKVYRKQAKIGFQNLVEHSYSPIRGLFISTQLNQPEAGASLISDQYVQIIQDARYKEAAKILLDVVKGYLTTVQLELSGGCDDDDAAINAAEAEATKYYKVAFGTLTQSVLTPDAVTSNVAYTDLEYYDDFAGKLAYFNYEAIRLAKDQKLNYSESLEQIKAIENEYRAAYPKFSGITAKLIQSRSNTTEYSTNLKDTLLAKLLHYVDNLFTGIRVVAKACHEVEAASVDDFETIRTVSNNVNSILENYDTAISSAHVSAIQTMYKIPTSIPTVIPTKRSIDGADVLIVRTGVGFSFN